MSLPSLLAFLAPMAARFKPVDETPRKADESPVDLKSHPHFIAGYDAGLADGRREVGAQYAQMRAHQQLAMVNPLTQQYGRYLQAQANLQMQQQMMAQAQQNAQFQELGLLAPGFAEASCTPSRSRALTGLGV